MLLLNIYKYYYLLGGNTSFSPLRSTVHSYFRVPYQSPFLWVMLFSYYKCIAVWQVRKNLICCRSSCIMTLFKKEKCCILTCMFSSFFIPVRWLVLLKHAAAKVSCCCTCVPWQRGQRMQRHKAHLIQVSNCSEIENSRWEPNCHEELVN